MSALPRHRTLPMSALASLAAWLLTPAATAAQQAPEIADADVQIASAVQAAPPALRDGATVLGWTPEGRSVVLREGTNHMICISDNPTDDAWSVACYPRTIEPYMARGRQLRAQGMTDPQEVLRRRWREAEEGSLPMPDQPATVYILHGRGFDAATGQVVEPFLRWAIYTPWATPEATGLPTQPTGPGAPWLMFPGTPGAHIMITPAPPGSGSARGGPSAAPQSNRALPCVRSAMRARTSSRSGTGISTV